MNLKKLFLSVALISFILIASCSKPRRGEYLARFSDSTGKHEFHCKLKRQGNSISLSDGLSGTITIHGDSASGTIRYYNSSVFSYTSYDYTIKGKYGRRSIYGSHTNNIERKDSSATPVYETSIGSFTFYFRNDD